MKKIKKDIADASELTRRLVLDIKSSLNTRLDDTQIVLGLSLLLHLVIAGILAYNFL